MILTLGVAHNRFVSQLFVSRLAVELQVEGSEVCFLIGDVGSPANSNLISWTPAGFSYIALCEAGNSTRGSALLFRRRKKKARMPPSIVIAPIETPIPTPAFAPVERVEDSFSCVISEAGVEVEVAVMDTTVLPVVEPLLLLVAAGSPEIMFVARVYIALVSELSSQQSRVLPQHHVSE